MEPKVRQKYALSLVALGITLLTAILVAALGSFFLLVGSLLFMALAVAVSPLSRRDLSGPKGPQCLPPEGLALLQEDASARLRRRLVTLKYDSEIGRDATYLLEIHMRVECARSEFLRALDARMRPGELTFERFESAVTEAFTGVVATLQDGMALAVARAPERHERFAEIRVVADLVVRKMEELTAAITDIGAKGDRDLHVSSRELENLTAQSRKYRA